MTYNVEITSINVELEQNVTEVEILVSFEIGVGEGGGGTPQIQSDWAQTDNAQVDFIKNKPTIPVIDPDTVIDANYVHTDNNFTDTLESKLDAIEEGAEVNIIEVVKVNNTPLTVTEKEVNIDLSGYSQTSHRHSGETITPDALFVTKTYSDAEIAALPTNTLFWDDKNKTYAFKTPDGGIIQVNQEPHDYYTNLEGAPIVNGDIVSSCGASGNRTAICLTDATNDVKAMAAFGMCTVATIGNNNVGRITKSGGKVRGLNTIDYAEGTILYVDPLNKGKWTGTLPTAPNRPIVIGTVAVSHAVEGVIELQIKTLPRLTELADVDGVETTVASGSSFLFKLTSGLWKTITESNFYTQLATIFAKLTGGNTFTGTQSFDNLIQHKVGEFFYIATSKTSDTINDRRSSVFAGVQKYERCTVANAAKGGGTWVVDFIIMADGKVGVSTTTPRSNMDIVGNLFLRNIIGNIGAGYAIEMATDTSSPRIDFIRNGVYSSVFENNNNIMYFRNRITNGSIEFYTNNTNLSLFLKGSGEIGVGTSTPKSKLDVNGGIKIADDTALASVDKVGTLRYRVSGNNTYCEMCMQTGASTYAWIPIIKNNW